jgi:hypothetical protein
MASSHAFTLLDPEKWDELRERNRAGYKRRYGMEPPVHPKIAGESLEENRVRHQRVKSGLDYLRAKLGEKKPDALILVGDDQSENFKEDNLPQVALYVGEEFLAAERGQSGQSGNVRYRSHAGLARDLLDGLVERDFDVSSSKSFANSELLSHAHAPILKTVAPEADLPVVLVFVNAIHMPAISPGRCYRLGKAINEIIERRSSPERIALYASGGLSHFTGGYPWRHYQGEFAYGSISEEFDRRALEFMRRGEGEKLSGLSTRDLLDHGDIEMRSWLLLLGAVGKTPAEVLAYEPFYRAIMGMAVAYWELGN